MANIKKIMKSIEIYEFRRSFCIARYWTIVTVMVTYGWPPRVNVTLCVIFCQYLATILPTAFDPAFRVKGYCKGNRHFQCCIETKLLMI